VALRYTYEDHCRQALEIIEQGPDSGFDGFNEYAIRIFNYQYENNEIYRKFVDAHKVDPETVKKWEDIPLVYNDVFKKELVSSFPLEEAIMIGVTGGTTSLSQRGSIFRDEWGKKLVFSANRIMTQTYLFPDFDEGTRCRILVLAPSPQVAPSMGMAIGMEQTIKTFGTPDSMFLLKRSGIDVKKLIEALRESEESGVPVALIGATSAFVFFFQACRRDGIAFNLPEGSRVCDGGGYRGRFGVVTRDDYYEMVEEILNVPNHFCVNILGEAETATNLSDDALYRHFRKLEPRDRSRPVPPWSRVRAMSIDNLTPLPDGEIGLLAHWDLANAPTVLGLITDNLGYTSHNGTACEIVGRAKIENNKVSPLPDEDRTVGALGDKPIFRMLESYTNFTIDIKMRLAKLRGTTPSVREEIEAGQEKMPDVVASCPAIVDEMLVAGEDEDAAVLVDASLEAFGKEPLI
jgi:hypothetical protein